LFAHGVHPDVLKGFNVILFIADDMIEELSLPALSAPGDGHGKFVAAQKPQP
jgi:hypothetical protein